MLSLTEEQIREVLQREFHFISVNQIDRVINRLKSLDEVNQSGSVKVTEKDKFIYIADMDLSKRTVNALKKSKITTLEELKKFVSLEGIEGLKKIRNLGRKSLYELEEAEETKDIFSKTKKE